MSERIFRFNVGDMVTPVVEGTAFYGERGVVAEQFASDGKVLVKVEFDGKVLTCFRDYHLRLAEPAPAVNELESPQTKFKVGDIVRVRKPKEPNAGWMSPDMDSYDGGVYEVRGNFGASVTFMNEPSWYFRHEWLEPAPTVNECLTVDNAQTTGKQAFVRARFDCINPLALRLVAECVGFGAMKYSEDNHKKISVRDHLNHAMNHINEHRTGDESEMHLVHAIARLLFAVELVVQSGAMEDRYFHPDMVEGVLKEVTSE
jgi:hypothetical protein